MNTRKVKVLAKLTVRKTKRQDITTKIGLGIALGFILPCAVALFVEVLTNGGPASFGMMG